MCCFEDVQQRPGQLERAQAQFAEHGVVDPDLSDIARKPQPEEARPDWFVPLAQFRAVLEAQLLEAFGDQDLAGGVSLAEAECIDNYTLPSRTVSDPPPVGHGTSVTWHEVTNGELEAYHWCNFSFMDPRGLRFYIPRYIQHFLREPHGRISQGSLLFLLEQGYQLDVLLSLMSGAQRTAVARYLAFLTLEPTGSWVEEAHNCLDARWGRYL